MKCRKCGTQNEDSLERCSNCNAPLYHRIEVIWRSVLLGVFAAFLVLLFDYLVYGGKGWFAYGYLFSAVIGGAVTAIFAKRENIAVVNDLNPVFNSCITGALFYLLSVPFQLFQLSPDLVGILILTIGFGMIAFLGGALGFFINILREQNTTWKIAGSLIIVLLLSVVVYGLFFSNSYNEGRYYHDLGVYCLSPMSLTDALDNETTVKLNGSVVYNIENETRLNDFYLRYQRMKNLTEYSLSASQELSPYASSDIERQYSLALEKYFTLRLDYYTKLELAANSTLQGDRSQAKEYYDEAQELIPQMKKQRATFKAMEDTDLEFQKRIEELLASANRLVINTKEQNRWMDPHCW